MNQRSKPKVLAIVGATATGKTRAAVNLARQFDGEIVNCDSRLFYKGMDVATAKPSAEERQGVPHHLIDTHRPDQSVTLAEYLGEARNVIESIVDSAKLPIIVGGSGQYFWGLIEGWEVPEIEPDTALRLELETTLEREGVQTLATMLDELAPEIASRTDLSNPRRVVRAIERVKAGYDTVESTRQKAEEPPFDAFIAGLHVDREELHTRVNERLSQMAENGWLQEVRSLRQAGYPNDSRAFTGIGYRQMLGHLNEEYEFEEAVRLTSVATNRLIRQQNNWFRQKDERISWYDMTNDPESAQHKLINRISDWLND